MSIIWVFVDGRELIVALRKLQKQHVGDLLARMEVRLARRYYFVFKRFLASPQKRKRVLAKLTCPHFADPGSRLEVEHEARANWGLPRHPGQRFSLRNR